MTDPYAYWKAALRGEKPRMSVDDPQPGFYRKGIYERGPSGHNRRVGWHPVAIFMNGSAMIGRVGTEADGRDVNGDRLNELWNSVASHAVTEEAWRAVAERGEKWPDEHDPSKNISSSDPTSNIMTMLGAIENAQIDDDPEHKLAAEITAAKAGVSQYATVESDEQSARALSLKNEITELAGKLDKHRETLVRPHIDAQREINGRLNPIINDAKADAQAILKAIGKWNDLKLETARRAQAEADQRALQYELSRAQAEQKGEQPPPPPAPIRTNTPAPTTQIAPATGRKASVKQEWFVTAIDADKVFEQFKSNPDVIELLTQLAQKAIRAGVDVPGAVKEQRSVVR